MGSLHSQCTPDALDKDALKILYYNIRSIIYKINEQSTNCSLYCPDIVCVTETRLNQDVLDTEVCIPNYQLVRPDQDRHGGGIVLCIANYLSYSIICSGPDHLEFLAISLKQTQLQGDVAITLLPSSPVSYFNNLSTVLEHMLCIPMFSTFLLVGDYNIDISIHSHLRHNFLYVTNQHGVSISCTDLTRVTSSSATTIDLIFTTSSTTTKSRETVPLIWSSDHHGILATFIHKSSRLNIQVPRRIW